MGKRNLHGFIITMGDMEFAEWLSAGHDHSAGPGWAGSAAAGLARLG